MAIIIKKQDELDRMRAAGGVAARIKLELAKSVSPGATTHDLDMYAKELIQGWGAKSCFIGYKGAAPTPYPAYTCISVNDTVVHGIPNRRPIQLGDIVSIDVGVYFEGFVGDNATTVMVGVTDPDVINLVQTAELALQKAIEQAVEGKRLSDISHAVEKAAKAAKRPGGKPGYAVVRDFVGHGVGRSMHEEPQIKNYGPPGRGPKLKAGMTLAIEPMLNLGRAEVEVLSDHWTVLTRDRLASCHVEHTVAVGKKKAEILTLPENV